MWPTKLEQCSTIVVYPPWQGSWYVLSTCMGTIHARIIGFRHHETLQECGWYCLVTPLGNAIFRTCLISRGWTECAWQLRGIDPITYYLFGILKKALAKKPTKSIKKCWQMWCYPMTLSGKRCLFVALFNKIPFLRKVGRCVLYGDDSWCWADLNLYIHGQNGDFVQFFLDSNGQHNRKNWRGSFGLMPTLRQGRQV